MKRWQVTIEVDLTVDSHTRLGAIRRIDEIIGNFPEVQPNENVIYTYMEKDVTEEE